MSKVLLVEDNVFCSELIMEELSIKGIETVLADTKQKASEIFTQLQKEIDLVIMDACVPGGQPNTMDLVEEIIAGGFNKPIIACSSIDEFGSKLMEVGATHKADKKEVSKLVMAILSNRL